MEAFCLRKVIYLAPCVDILLVPKCQKLLIDLTFSTQSFPKTLTLLFASRSQTRLFDIWCTTLFTKEWTFSCDGVSTVAENEEVLFSLKFHFQTHFVSWLQALFLPPGSQWQIFNLMERIVRKNDKFFPALQSW